MKKIIYLLIISIWLVGCNQLNIEEISYEGDNFIKNLPKYPEQTIELTINDYIPERIKKTGLNNNISTRAGTIIRDSIWPNGFGISYFGVADESIIMENMQRYIYPGSLLKGNTIADANYANLSVPIKPITLSVSFPAKRVSGVLNNPSLSSTRQFVNDIVRQEGIGNQSASLSFEIDQFTSYEELKVLFGSNKKTSGIFFSSSSGEENFEHKISKSTGIVVKFTQKYFTLDMDIPQNGLINGDISGLVQYSPVYVSSIAYGRMGIMTIETNESYEDGYSKITEAFNKLFVNKQTNISESVKSLIRQAVIKVFLVGSDGKSSVMAVNGFESFLNVITEGSEFNENNFGAPLYSTFSYLTDHSPFKINFKINLDSPPVYARIEYRNQRKIKGDNIIYYDVLNEHIYEADVYVSFYADMGAKMKTIAPQYINFNVIEERVTHKVNYNTYTPGPTFAYSNKYYTNSLRAVERFIGTFHFRHTKETLYDWGRLVDLDNLTIMHFLGQGRFYKGIPPKDFPQGYRHYVGQDYKYHDYPYPSGAY